MLLRCLAQLASKGWVVWLQVLAGTALALAAGLFPVRVPGTKNAYAVGEISVFLLLLMLMLGPAASAVAAACESFVVSCRTSKRWTSRLFTPASATSSMWLAGSLLQMALASLAAAGWSGAAVVLQMALHLFFRQQEEAKRLRSASVEVAEREARLAGREAEVAARHLRELQASERRFQSAFTHASIGMALLAFDGRVLLANPVLAALLGQEADALKQARFQHRVRSEARRSAEAGLAHRAFHDSLTGLPVRRRFLECLAGAVARSKADPQHVWAVMFLDLARFKLVNDSLGHNASDDLLQQLARRLPEKLRPSGPGQSAQNTLGGFEALMRWTHRGGLASCLTLSQCPPSCATPSSAPWRRYGSPVGWLQPAPRP